MAIPGQRFELDLDADDFTINPIDESSLNQAFRIKDIQEHDFSDVPPPPAPKPTGAGTGFPQHKQRKVSRFKEKQEQSRHASQTLKERPPLSDAALAHEIGQREDVNIEAAQKAEIGVENDRRIAAMSATEIEEARAEIMSTLSPALIERLLKRARIDDDDHEEQQQHAANDDKKPTNGDTKLANEQNEDLHTQPNLPADTLDNNIPDSPKPPTQDTASKPPTTSIHFPTPPREVSSYRPLDPNSETFLSDLKETYFPELAHQPTPTSLTWLQDEPSESTYSPTAPSYSASSIRFSFTGALIPPRTSLTLPTHLGLHHHGASPESAGYTVPELTLLARSHMPNQRCIAYQIVGRMLYRLGSGGFGPPGSEIVEALWDEVEKERILELVMAEANRGKGHASARAHATEALWLWRKGCNGERGIRKASEKVAK
jgi:RNA polymerase II-associated protein 1